MKAIEKRPFNKGFTLLEVLIALAIVAISTLAVLGQSGQSLTQLQQLQGKTTAILLAENQLNVLQIKPNWPALGSGTESLSWDNQQWQVHTEVSATSDPWFRKIVISVRLGQHQQLMAELTGYRGLY